MGGRGTYASGKSVSQQYVCVGYIHGVKVIVGKGKLHKLPEESHSSSTAYIRLDHKGNFYQYREYNSAHKLTFEIGYHREPSLGSPHSPVLHVHEYGNDMNERTTRHITPDEIDKYQKFFKGLKL